MFHGKDTWSEQIEEVAGERPVIFMNKYQHPSVYWFYTGKMAFTRNNLLYRRNQFDIWPLEAELEGVPVLLTRWGDSDTTQLHKTVHGDLIYYKIERYCSFNRLRIDLPENDIESAAGMSFTIPVKISNRTDRTVSLDCDCDLPPLLMYSYITREKSFQYEAVDPQPLIGRLAPGEETNFEITIKAPAQAGQYRMLVSFGSAILLPGINGPPAEITVVPVQETGLAHH
jgi:hypothetical protein